MSIASKYEDVINQINNKVIRFNEMLADDHKLITISSDDPTTYTESMDRPWGEQGWPSKDDCGVYFLCGHHEDNKDELGIYIGKASLMAMGNRMYSHLTKYRNTGIYKKGPYIIQAMCAIPMKNSETACIASALEEYLITRGLHNINLINKVGKRN